MNTLSKLLTWLGVVPFLTLLLIKLSNLNLLGVTPEFLFLLYSTVIISFMAGALWGRTKHQKNSPHNSTLIITNLWALCAYFTLILVSINPMYMNVSLLILSIGFTHILFTEYRHSESQLHYPSKYLWMRCQITTVVVILHLAIVFL
jgi:hypothetical protein